MIRSDGAPWFELLDAADDTHASLYRTLYTSPKVMRAIAPVFTPEAADRACLRMSVHNRQAVPGHRLWVIRVNAQRTGLGLVGLMREGDRAEFGLMLTPGAFGGRISASAVSYALEHAFRNMHVGRVDVQCQVGSVSRVAARLLRPHAARLLAPSDTHQRWEILAQDWLERWP